MKKISLFFILIFSCLTFASAQKVKLSFNPVQGKTYQFNYKMSQNIITGEAGSETTMKQNMSMLFEAKVLENKKNTIKMGYTYKDISFEMISDQINMKYKYNEPVEENMFAQLMSKIFDGLIGHEFQVTHTPNGSVTNVSGIEAIIESMKKAFENEGPIAQMLDGMLDSFLNEKTMKEMFEQSLKIYPDKKIKVGDSWNVNRQIAMMNINMDIHATYTLDSITKQTANVTLLSSIQLAELEGKQNGTIIYDLKTGMPLETNMTQTFKTTTGQPMKIETQLKMSMN